MFTAKLENGKTKQEVVVADSSCVIIVTLWEEKLDILVVSNPTSLLTLIREFNMTKNLTLHRQGSNIEVVDIGPVQENSKHLKLENSNRIFNTDIISVKQLETFSACVSCKVESSL